MSYKLIIFDLEGTLSEYKTGAILPGVVEKFALMEQTQIRPLYALASNQGGVGLREWTKEFGDPSQYPTESEIRTLVNAVLSQIPGGNTFDVHLCFAYQSKRTGVWGTIPADKQHLPVWNPDNRKPAPGMLLAAMHHAGVEAHETLMVGDWDEDREAAEAAQCYFMLADEFFGR